MSHPNRVTVPSQPLSCGSVHASLTHNRDFLTTCDEGRSPTSAASPSITKDPTQRRWPANMTEVASTGTAVGAIGDAVILQGRLPDSYQHHSAANNLFSFGLRGSRRVRMEAGRATVAVRRIPRVLHDHAAGEDNSICMDRSMQILNVVFGRDHLCPGRPGVEALWPDHRALAGLPSEHAGDRLTGAGVRVLDAFAPEGKRSLCRDSLDPDRDPAPLALLVAAAPGRNVGGTTRRHPFPARDRLPRRVGSLPRSPWAISPIWST